MSASRPHSARPSRLGSLLAPLLLVLFAVLLPTGASAATVDTGSIHTCAVAEGGAAYCWGANDSGQLGNGTKQSAARPVQASGITNATEIAVSTISSCALLSDHTVKCWGSNAGGALGDNTGIDSTTPVQVSGLDDAIAIDSVSNSFCALRDGGRVSCWGSFGSALMGDEVYAPKDLDVSGALDISGGDTELCVVWSAGTVCRATMVENQYGGGVPATGVVEIPNSVRIQKLDTTPWAQFDGCAVLASGQVSCWGRNSHGELGNGVTNDARMPRGQSLVVGISDARSVFSTFGSSCALRENGDVSCWGTSSYLPPAGVATSIPVTTPVVRDDLSGIIAIAGADYHACATTQDRALQCWGFNHAGQLGDGTQIQRLKAVTVEGLTVAVSARDAVTPVRRGEADITVPDPVPGTTPGTTPAGTTPGTTPAGTTPWGTTPTGTTPTGTTPTGTTPGSGTIGGGDFPPLGLPTILFQDGVLILVDFKVAPLRSGRCPKQVRVTVRSGRVSMTKTLVVTTGADGRCSVTGSVRLGRRLAKASRLTTTVGAPGGLRTVRKVVKTP